MSTKPELYTSHQPVTLAEADTASRKWVKGQEDIKQLQADYDDFIAATLRNVHGPKIEKIKKSMDWHESICKRYSEQDLISRDKDGGDTNLPYATLANRSNQKFKIIPLDCETMLARERVLQIDREYESAIVDEKNREIAEENDRRTLEEHGPVD